MHLHTSTICFCAALILAMARPAPAQSEAEETADFTHLVGLKFSGLSGGGLSYEIRFEDIAIEASGYVDYYKSPGYRREEFVFGLENQHALQRSESWRIYSLAALWYSSTARYTDHYVSFGIISETETTTLLAASIGIGAEWTLWEGIALNLDGGIVHRNTVDGPKSDRESRLTLGGGISYRL